MVSAADICEPPVADVVSSVEVDDADAAEDDVVSSDGGGGGGGGPKGCVADAALLAGAVLLAGWADDELCKLVSSELISESRLVSLSVAVLAVVPSAVVVVPDVVPDVVPAAVVLSVEAEPVSDCKPRRND